MIDLVLLKQWRMCAGVAALLVLVLFCCPDVSHAGTVVLDFSGQTDAAVTVGGNSIPSGSVFQGQLSYDAPQTAAVTSFYGGTQSVFSFNSLTWTIGGQTVSEGPGQLGLYNNVTPPNGVPVGDSFYTFVPGISNNAPNPSTGSIDGVAPNYIYLGFVRLDGHRVQRARSAAELEPGGIHAGFHRGQLRAVRRRQHRPHLHAFLTGYGRRSRAQLGSLAPGRNVCVGYAAGQTQTALSQAALELACCGARPPGGCRSTLGPPFTGIPGPRRAAAAPGHTGRTGAAGFFVRFAPRACRLGSRTVRKRVSRQCGDRGEAKPGAEVVPSRSGPDRSEGLS